MPYVLDATALRSGIAISDKSQWFTTPGVIEEVRLGKAGKDVQLLGELSITVRPPAEDSLREVKAAAAKTGDLDRLSATDIEVLSLANELGATLVSDDYSVQNVASMLGIECTGSIQGIRKTIQWTYRCRGCGKYYERMQPDCPVCGSEVRQVPTPPRSR